MDTEKNNEIPNTVWVVYVEYQGYGEPPRLNDIRKICRTKERAEELLKVYGDGKEFFAFYEEVDFENL